MSNYTKVQQIENKGSIQKNLGFQIKRKLKYFLLRSIYWNSLLQLAKQVIF